MVITSESPSVFPSAVPSVYPSVMPPQYPSFDQIISLVPSALATGSMEPSVYPSEMPSQYPSFNQIYSPVPSALDTGSMEPSIYPSEMPSQYSSSHQIHSPVPSALDTGSIDVTSKIPSVFPSVIPSDVPSEVPYQYSSSVTPSTTAPSSPLIDRPFSVHGLQPDCSTDDPSRFNICLDVRSDSGQVEGWFEALWNATSRWERIITADTRPESWGADKTSLIRDEFIATAKPALSIDDLYVAVVMADLDESYFALANHTLLHYNFASQRWQVVAGRIQINRSRLNEATPFLENILLRKLGEILGIGLLWGEYNLIQNSRYLGSNALAAWRDLGCTGPLPVSGYHWDGKCLLHEVK